MPCCTGCRPREEAFSAHFLKEFLSIPVLLPLEGGCCPRNPVAQGSPVASLGSHSVRSGTSVLRDFGATGQFGLCCKGGVGCPTAHGPIRIPLTQRLGNATCTAASSTESRNRALWVRSMEIWRVTYSTTACSRMAAIRGCVGTVDHGLNLRLST